LLDAERGITAPQHAMWLSLKGAPGGRAQQANRRRDGP
jgi:hypothetical protein